MMCEGKITILAKLWKKILWNRAKHSTLWKHAKFHAILLICSYAGLLSSHFIMKENALLINPLWLLPGWFFLVSISSLKTFFLINRIKEDYSFYVRLDEKGVETKKQKTAWKDYKFYLEYDDYLEIHGPNKSISFLPKNLDTKEIVDYTKSLFLAVPVSTSSAMQMTLSSQANQNACLKSKLSRSLRRSLKNVV